MMAAAIGIGGAVLLSLTDSGTAGMTAYAFNIGPGMEDHDIIYYQEQPENNPAYNNGWTSNVGPGASGSNPGGGLDSEKDYVYSMPEIRLFSSSKARRRVWVSASAFSRASA